MSSSEAPLDTITTSYMPKMMVSSTSAPEMMDVITYTPEMMVSSTSAPEMMDVITYTPEMMVSSTSTPETIRPRGEYSHQPGKRRRIPTLAPLTSMMVSPAPPLILSSPATAQPPPPVIPTQEVMAPVFYYIQNKKWLMGIVITAAVLAVVVAVNIFIYFYYRIKKQQPMPSSDTRIQILPRPTFSALISQDRAPQSATINKPPPTTINKQPLLSQVGFSTQTPKALLPMARQVITQRIAQKTQSPVLKKLLQQRENKRQQIIIPDSIQTQRKHLLPTKLKLQPRFLNDVEPVPVIPTIQPYHFKS